MIYRGEGHPTDQMSQSDKDRIGQMTVLPVLEGQEFVSILPFMLWNICMVFKFCDG